MSEPILSIRDLCVDYVTPQGSVRAVDSLDLDIYPGEFIGIAGESGSGKSTLAQTILRILPPPAVVRRGSIRFEGADILDMEEEQLRRLRWDRISMVFQSAMDALNPVIPVGEQITDILEAHDAAGGSQARDRAAELFDLVDIAADRLGSYPHQLSGGMRQRVCIAMALALKPAVVLLDEPTTALDVVVERDILQRIRDLQTKLGFTVMFITHDLARMLQFSDRVAILYAARLAEVAPVDAMARQALHPYSAGLLRAFPSVLPGGPEPVSIPGSPPSLRNPPSGCRFHPRCSKVMDRCHQEQPELRSLADGRWVACHAVD